MVLSHGSSRAEPFGRGHEREPLAAYTSLIAAFLICGSSAARKALRRGALRTPVPLRDAALLGLATARLAHLITREKVAAPLRAPFTECPPDRAERARGRGVTRALGELLTCPRCFAVWAATGLCIAYALAPRPTRLAASILASSLLSDAANAQLARLRSPYAR